MTEAPRGRQWLVIPFRERRAKALKIAAGTAAALVAVWLVQASNGHFAEYWWYPWPAALVGLAVSLKTLFQRRKLVFTPEGAEEEKALQIEKYRKDREREDKWWFRYPLAAFMFWGAWNVYVERPRSWWLAVLFVVAALFVARELALVLIAAALIGGAFFLVSGLPVSVAIIVGASIIAWAIYARR